MAGSGMRDFLGQCYAASLQLPCHFASSNVRFAKNKEIPFSRHGVLTKFSKSVNCDFSMATMPNPVQGGTSEDPLLELDFPQREAAFFYGLFLRGHSADELRRDIQVPAGVLAKWDKETT